MPTLPGSRAPMVFVTALEALERVGVAYRILRDGDLPRDLRELDLLVWPGDAGAFDAAVAESGFVPQPCRAAMKRVYAVVHDQALYRLDVHHALVQRGLEYLPLAGLEGRACRTPSGFAGLTPEDSLLHQFFHALVGKGRLQPKHLPVVRQILSERLDTRYLDARLGGGTSARVFRRFVANPESFTHQSRATRRDARRLARALTFASAANLGRTAARWLRTRTPVSRLWRRGSIRRRRRSRTKGLLVAFVGIDGAGKTTAVELVGDALSANGVRSHRVYMGPWGHYQTPLVQVARRLGLRDPHRAWRDRVSAAGDPRGPWWRPWRILTAAIGELRGALYYLSLAGELWYRYLRDIRPHLRRDAVVLSDRYVSDLRFIHRQRPAQGLEAVRALVSRRFPQPDMAVVLGAPAHVIGARAAQVADDQIERVQALYRRSVDAYPVLDCSTDGHPEAAAGYLAGRILQALVEKRAAAVGVGAGLAPRSGVDRWRGRLPLVGVLLLLRVVPGGRALVLSDREHRLCADWDLVPMAVTVRGLSDLAPDAEGPAEPSFDVVVLDVASVSLAHGRYAVSRLRDDGTLIVLDWSSDGRAPWLGVLGREWTDPRGRPPAVQRAFPLERLGELRAAAIERPPRAAGWGAIKHRLRSLRRGRAQAPGWLFAIGHASAESPLRILARQALHAAGRADPSVRACRLRISAGSLVLIAEDGRGRGVVVRLATTRRGLGRLERNRWQLSALARRGYPHSPRPVEVDDTRGYRWTAELALAGDSPGSRFPRASQADAGRLVAGAFEALVSLHRLGELSPFGQAERDRYVTPRLDLIARYLERAGRPSDAVRSLGAHLWRACRGRPVRVGISHGDVSFSNGLFEGSRLVGFVDWDSGSADDLSWFDAAHLLCNAARRRGAMKLRELILGCPPRWEFVEPYRAYAHATGTDVLPIELNLLLYWVSSVTGQLASGEVTPLWFQRNLIDVAERLEPMLRGAGSVSIEERSAVAGR